MLRCLRRKLISCGSLACVASVSVWFREENGAGNPPSFIFWLFFHFSRTQTLVVPISCMNPWITAGAMIPDEFRVRVYS